MTRTSRSSAIAASHKLEQHIRGHKVVQSVGEAWIDVEAQIFRRGPRELELLVPGVAEPLVVWVMSGRARVEERKLDGEWHGGVVTSGSFYLTQTDEPYLMRWQAETEEPFEVMHLYLGLDLVGRAARSLGLDPARIQLRDVSGIPDAVTSGILSGLAEELKIAQQANPLFVKGLVESLTVHLLRNYAELHNAIGRRPTQLAAWKLRKALEHMDAHLSEPFNLDRIADLCGMSRFHFSRAFRNAMGKSPSHWQIVRRIDKAKELLQDTDKQIVEIALAVGYDSPSHFAKLFRAETGVTPRQYREV